MSKTSLRCLLAEDKQVATLTRGLSLHWVEMGTESLVVLLFSLRLFLEWLPRPFRYRNKKRLLRFHWVIYEAPARSRARRSGRKRTEGRTTDGPG